MARGRSNPRRINGTKRNKLREFVRRQELPCALCGKPIDYSLPSGHPMSYELDEIVPVSRGGSPYELTNVQPAHRLCNQRKGNRVGASLEKAENGRISRSGGVLSDPLPRSRDW